MPFPLFLAFKYIKPRRSIASVITCVSIIGVMLGVAVVLIVRSVMTGFGDEWRKKILEFKPHVSVVASAERLITGEEELASAIGRIPGVECASQVVNSRILFSHRNRVQAPIMIGVSSTEFTKAYQVGRPIAGTFDLEPDSVVIGRELAYSLGVWVGDTVTVCAPPSPNEVYLPRKWKVSGIFSSGHYDYDIGYVVADIDSARDLIGMEEGALAIHVKTNSPLDAEKFPEICKVIRNLAQPFRTITWRAADKQLFDALAVETNMTAILLSLISVVALFCVMNTLLVLSVQKTPEIGLLKSLGFGRFRIMSVFLVHGLIQCSAGIILGLLVSWAILNNLQNIVEWLGRMGMEVFPASIYQLQEIPHRLMPSDVVFVVVSIFVFGLLASLIPAMLAALKDPVRALNE